MRRRLRRAAAGSDDESCILVRSSQRCVYAEVMLARWLSNIHR